jgi:hypothetical protein
MTQRLVRRWPFFQCDLLLVGAAFLFLAVPLSAQDTPVGPAGTLVATEETPAAATNADALRKAAQNPVASLISVPVQDNFNFNISPADRTQGVLNIQPVIPTRISESWNLITRVITPIILSAHSAGPGPGYHPRSPRAWRQMMEQRLKQLEQEQPQKN